MFKVILVFISSFCLLNSTSIEGTVSYAGNPKTPKTVKMDSDPICGAAHAENPAKKEDFILNSDKKFKNVIVWLKPADGNSFNYENLNNSPITIDQVGCRYTPHVNVVTVGQKVLIKNSDATLHNINSKSKVNATFNSAQPAGVPEIEKVFSSSENPFYIKCDVHPWMKAWVMVADHPFFAITDENGFYSIDNVPAGNYEIIFWQEKLSNLPTKKYEIASNSLPIVVTDTAGDEAGENAQVVDFEFQKPIKKAK